jgi:cyanophycin synthetase
VVISGAGDRRDDDIRQQTEILGDAFDEVILYQDACQRGRADGEVIALLREGLVNASRTKYGSMRLMVSSLRLMPHSAVCNRATSA